jgi:hypothetical protein
MGIQWGFMIHGGFRENAWELMEINGISWDLMEV